MSAGLEIGWGLLLAFTVVAGGVGVWIVWWLGRHGA